MLRYDRTIDRHTHRFTASLARRLGLRAKDLGDGIKLTVIVVLGVAFILWWQSSQVL